MSVSFALVFLELFVMATMINISFCNGNSYVGCIDGEREALLKLKQDLEDPSSRLASWNIRDEDCCAWDGVVCNNFTGHVLQLNLGNPNPDPNFGTGSTLVGKINSSLVDLKHLIHLDLSGNDFQAIQIPKYLGSLKNLRYLNLSGAEFAGVIPYQLGNLSNLQYLDLSKNYNVLQVESLSWLSGLSLLEHLDLSLVDLSKSSDGLLKVNSLPSLKVLKLSSCELHHFPSSSSANFSSLKALDLSGNHFNNSLFQYSSSVFGLRNLDFFDLSDNEFQGRIPIGLGNFMFLRHLDLSSNEFNSAIPGWLSKLNDLEFLSLRGNSLRGTISSMGLEKLTSIKTLDLSSNAELRGQIPTSFVRLCKLTSIDVSYVKLGQDLSQILDIFSSCGAYALESLVLSSCHISGQMTNQLGQFKSLHTLELKDNSLSGPLPSALGELTFLTDLDLSENRLNGSIPLSLGQILNLEHLDLSNNLLNGAIPMSLGKLSHLEYLDLSNNKLNGSIPLSLGQILNLEHLDLSSNLLNGAIPMSLGQLSHLKLLDLSNNTLNGTLSEIHFVNLTKLTLFSISGNSLILQVNPNWVPPFQLDELKLTSCHLGPHFPSWLHSQNRLSVLDISYTRISDTIPRWFWDSISQYAYLNLSSNQIYGDISNLVNRQSPLVPITPHILDFSNNSFSGSIFPLICNGLRTISHLKLSKNYLSGDIPDCWMNWPFLEMLNFGNNNLTGSLPTSIGTLRSLRSLNLRNNRLSGVVPESFKNCSNLVTLDMGENEFVGNIPTWMGERLSGLSILILRSNKFHGYLPIQLCGLTSLQILDVAHNNLSGAIPRCINNFTAMATTDPALIPIGMDASVVTKGVLVEYSTIVDLVKSIDISKNNFSGEIPMELTNLKGLQSLNLSYNFFTSKIPEKIGDMKSIESLDFSANQLSGEIPRSMSSLSFLSYLNLSNNHLTGKIPSSTQLQSFDAYSFAGNNLCGAPLPNCTEKNPLVPEDPNGNGNEDEDEDEVDWLLYVSLALGFVVGFWCFIGPLLVIRRWRFKYCHFLEGFMDEFCCFVRRCY